MIRNNPKRPTRVRVWLSKEPKETVGYGQPPRSTRFKSGQSGNPRGRPKGAKSEAEIIHSLLQRKVDLRTRAGGLRKITVFEAVFQKIVEDAVKGNLKCAQFLVNRKSALEMNDRNTDILSEDDNTILQTYLEKYAKDKIS